MKLLGILIVICVFTLTWSLIPLKKQQIGTNYQIGKIKNLYFLQDFLILFRSQDDLIGTLDGTTGELKSVYEFDTNETVIQFEHKYDVIIARGKKINVFIPENQNYFRLIEETKQLQKFDFNSIIGFKRNRDYAFILTDRFVVRMAFQPNNGTLIKKDVTVLVQLNNQQEEFFNLLFLLDDKAGGVVLTSLLHGSTKQEVCFRLLTTDNIQPKCLQIPTGAKIVDIVRSSHFIYVEFEGSAWILGVTFQKIGQIDQAPQQYFNGFVVVGENHKYYDPFSKTMYSTRVIQEQSLARTPQLTMKVEQQNMLIQQSSKDIVTIAKTKDQDPRKVWADWDYENEEDHRLYVQFEDDRLVCYKIAPSDQQYTKLWQISTSQAIKEQQGTIQDQQNQSDAEDIDQDVSNNSSKNNTGTSQGDSKTPASQAQSP